MTVQQPMTRGVAGIVVGAVLVATFLIPFRVAPGQNMWSWDVVAHRLQGAGFLAGAWSIGFAALFCGTQLRRLPLAVCYLVAGTIGMVLVWHVTGFFSHLGVLCVDLFGHTVAVFQPVMSDVGLWQTFGTVAFMDGMVKVVVVLLVAFLSITGMRARLGARLPVCAIQVIVSAALALILGFCLYQALPAIREFKGRSVLAIAVMMISQGAVVAAAVTGIWDGLAFKSENLLRARVLRVVGATGAVLLFIAPSVPLELSNAVPTSVYDDVLTYLMSVTPAVIVTALFGIFIEGVVSFSSEMCIRLLGPAKCDEGTPAAQ